MPAALGEHPTTRVQVVSDDYFTVLGVPMVEGRQFESRDGAQSTPVVVINRAFARRYFPQGGAVGHVLQHELTIVPGQPTRRQIVGVMGDVRQFGLDEPFEPQMFIPHTQMPWPAMAVVVRATIGGERVASAVRDIVRQLDPRMPVPVGTELTQAFDAALGEPRVRAWVLSLFALTALVLAAIGLYGTIAFSVEQRRRELGLRLALGATPRGARSLVMREGLSLAVAGVSLGVVCAFGLTRLVASLLFDVSAFDPATIGAVACLLLGVSALSCYLPARRASRIDPLKALNSE